MLFFDKMQQLWRSRRVRKNLDDSRLSALQRFPLVRLGQDLPRVTVDSHSDIVTKKLDLIKSIGSADSIRDFGGLYVVNGKYLLESALELGCSYAHEIDGTPTAGFEEERGAALLRDSNLRIDYSQVDFREPELYRSIAAVDISLLYEVLLHQENYVQVIANVIGKTRNNICVAQPCMREELFRLPAGAVCLQFYDEALKDLLRQRSWWPKEPRVHTFVTSYWMWGHTTSHLITIFKGFGWELDRGEVIDNGMGLFWEYPLLRFRKGTVRDLEE